MCCTINYVEDSVFVDEKPVKLTTFKRLEESIIEEQDVGCEKESFLKEDSEVKEIVPENHETDASSSNEKGFDEIESAFEVRCVGNQEKPSNTVTKVKPVVLPRTKK